MRKFEVVSPEEAERILLMRWHAQHPEAAEGEVPNDEERARLEVEIAERQAAIEQAALAMLMQATRNQPSRSGGNSKYMQLFWLVFVVGFVVVGLVWVIYSLVTTGRI